MYNNFYIFYCFSNIYVGQLVYQFENNRFDFHRVDFNPFYLKELNYQINWNSHVRDKIVYFNSKNVCIRNSQKLVYGNLNLRPKEQNAIQNEPLMNVHKYLLLENFKFSFFNENSVIDSLITGKKYYLYNLIYQYINQDKPKFQFNPENIYQTLYMNKKEFQEATGYQNDQQFIQELENFDSTKLCEQKNKFLRDGINIIKDTEQKSQTLDVPSKILYLLDKYSCNNKLMTSEMVVMAICTDQKTFLFQNFFPKSNMMMPPTWDELKQKCVVYWYEDVQGLKRMIDRSTMQNYKKNKKVFDIIIWFVLLGKVKLLVPLFKLEPGQQKFVIFFSSNFNDEKVQEQAINNAFKLKSCKKFDLCAAFFILAKQYAEAMTITLEHMNDPQLTVLIYRVFYQQIQMQQNQKDEIENLLKNYFLNKGQILNENFLQAIYYHITQQPDEFIKNLIEAKRTKKFLYFEDQNENSNFGFRLVNYSTNLKELFNYLKKSSSYKRYFQDLNEEEEKQENLKLLWKNFYYYYLQDQIYQALVCMIEIKLIDEEFFKDKIQKHQKLFKEIFLKICLKRLKKVIKKKQYWRLKIKEENNKQLINYFDFNYKRIKKQIQRRINLIDDFELSLFNDLLQQDYVQAENYFKKLQNKLLKLNKKMLKRDIFKYDSNHNWIEKINFVEKFIEMLNNLFISSDEFYLDMFRKHKDEFSDLIIFWLFLISLHTNCWEEAIEILENYKIFDILSENFTKILENLRNKILNKFNFIKQCPIQHTKDLEFNFSNVNVLVFLFIKGLYFDSFLQKRNQKNEQSFNSNLIPIQLGKSLQEYLNEIQNQFFQLLKSFTFEEQKMIFEEFKELFNSNLATVQRLNFFILTPLEALKLEENKKFNSDCLVKQKWYNKIQDYVYLFLLKENYICESKEKIEIKSLLFKQGIEIFKLKPEQNTMNFFTSGLIEKILIIEQQQYPEIFILVNKKIRKVYLYNALFKEDRINEGYNLKNYDNINSISMVSENIVTLSEEFLHNKPFMTRILYQLFYQKINTQGHNHCKQIYEKIIDSKIQKREDFNSVTLVEKYNELPIMFVVQYEKLFIISNKTLAILCHYSNQNIKKIKHIIPDKKGFRILIIDDTHNAYILKFDLSFKNIIMVHEIKNKQIYHGNWNEDSTQIYFTTNTQTVILFDLIEISFKEFQIDNYNIVKSHIYYIKKIDKILILNKKYSSIGLYDKENLQEIDSTVIKQTEKIFCYAISDKKEIIVLGHQNGEIRFINLCNLEQVDLKTYNDNEGKKLKVYNITFIKDFLICSFSNGIVSIIDKI